MSGPCSPHDASVQCAERRAATRAGEFYYDFRLGWLFPAEHRAWPKLMREEHKVPFAWTWCPFCGGVLPDLVDIWFGIITTDEGTE